jgi:mRNA interferase MazF
MSAPERGEVWLVDLGMAAKVRPCLVLSIPVLDTGRALATSIARRNAPPDLFEQGWTGLTGWTERARTRFEMGRARRESCSSWLSLLFHPHSEVPIRVHFLREGVFDIQNMITVPHARYIRNLGKLTDAQLQMIVNVVRLWLHL